MKEKNFLRNRMAKLGLFFIIGSCFVGSVKNVYALKFPQTLHDYREGLSDSELYGNGSQSILNENSDSGKQKITQKSLPTSSTTTALAPTAKTTQATTENQNNEKKQKEEKKQEEEKEKKADVVIEGVEDGAYYNDSVSCKVKVENVDDNEQTRLDARYTDLNGQLKEVNPSIRKDGKLVEDTLDCTEEGAYCIRIGVYRKQKLLEEQMKSFTVDKTAPVIQLDDWKDAGERRISLETMESSFVTDRNLKETHLFVDQQEVREQELEEDKEYEITVVAKDRAGNTTDQSVRISQNTTENAEVVLDDTDEEQSSKKQMKASLSYKTMAATSVIIIVFVGSLLIRKERKKLIGEDENE